MDFVFLLADQAPHDHLTTPEAALLVGILNLVGVLLVAIIGWMTKRHAKNADNAVNNVPKNSPRLVEMVAHVHEQMMEVKENMLELLHWKRSYKDSPWNDGAGVQQWLDEHTERQKEIRERVEHIERNCESGECVAAITRLRAEGKLPSTSSSSGSPS